MKLNKVKKDVFFIKINQYEIKCFKKILQRSVFFDRYLVSFYVLKRINTF